jgi:hypothetical protein
MNPLPTEVDSTLLGDIESLMHIFNVGRYADWDIITSNKAIEELSQTKNGELKEALLDYGVGLVPPNFVVGDKLDPNYANDLARRLRHSRFMMHLPDYNDRDLIAHAIAMRCDAFCTRDIRTIHKKRKTLKALPIEILTPAEWL